MLRGSCRFATWADLATAPHHICQPHGFLVCTHPLSKPWLVCQAGLPLLLTQLLLEPSNHRSESQLNALLQ